MNDRQSAPASPRNESGRCLNMCLWAVFIGIMLYTIATRSGADFTIFTVERLEE
jgi:dihydrodipicolinate synthase/N-acetylneuraminate lyase